MATPVIKFAHSDEGWGGYREYLNDLLHLHAPHEVLEVGGGANPTIPVDILQQRGINYSVLDISAEELAKAPAGYHTICADIASPDFFADAAYDLVFSQMLAEHVKSGEQFHRNIYQLLRSGGIAFHFFPTLYTLPFVANRLIPERFADWILSLLRPGRDRYQHAKFPAYYSWCRGPTRRQIRRLSKLGYEVLEYRGFFGHEGYYDRVPLLRWLHILKTKFLLKHPAPCLTSFAYVVLRKPA